MFHRFAHPHFATTIAHPFAFRLYPRRRPIMGGVILALASGSVRGCSTGADGSASSATSWPSTTWPTTSPATPRAGPAAPGTIAATSVGPSARHSRSSSSRFVPVCVASLKSPALQAGAAARPAGQPAGLAGPRPECRSEREGHLRQLAPGCRRLGPSSIRRVVADFAGPRHGRAHA